MLNKKGGVAIEEIVGIMVFFIVITLVGLLFYGCQVVREKLEYEKFEFSKDEIQLIRDLNYILQKPVGQDKTVSDLIIEIIRELYLNDSIDIYSDAIKGELDKITNEYFKGYRRLMILTMDGGFLYDSDNRYSWRQVEEVAEGVAKLSIPIENGFEFIEVVLQ